MRISRSRSRETSASYPNSHEFGYTLWRTLILPSIFPYWITGACTAAAGAWNASIVAEWATWGGTTLKAQGATASTLRAVTRWERAAQHHSPDVSRPSSFAHNASCWCQRSTRRPWVEDSHAAGDLAHSVGVRGA